MTVAIVGPPNAGKSSLFNALLGTDRAIVTAEAGTTRDVVEATIVVSGVPVRLLDTAGLGIPRDSIDAEGMRRTRRAVEGSDLLVVLVEGFPPPEPLEWRRFTDDLPEVPRITAYAKSDLWMDRTNACPAYAIPVSVRTTAGLDAFLSRLRTEVEQRSGSDSEESPILASLRQIELLDALGHSIRRAVATLFTQPTEILLVELRAALDTVGRILGVEVADSVLDTVFARFCVGK